MSEDLPHKSGITTVPNNPRRIRLNCRKTCPTNRGLRPVCANARNAASLVGRLAPQIGDYDRTRRVRRIGLRQSEDLPHKSGITTRSQTLYGRAIRSEDLPHKSGITTHGQRMIFDISQVGRLAPQIGDYDSKTDCS